MEDILALIESAEGLHDAKLEELIWRASHQRLELSVKDLHANFRGLPEYAGPIPAGFIFHNVSGLKFELSLSERGLLIYEWTITRNEVGSYSSELAFSPSGKITIDCLTIECITRLTD